MIWLYLIGWYCWKATQILHPVKPSAVVTCLPVGHQVGPTQETPKGSLTAEKLYLGWVVFLQSSIYSLSACKASLYPGRCESDTPPPHTQSWSRVQGCHYSTQWIRSTLAPCSETPLHEGQKDHEAGLLIKPRGVSRASRALWKHILYREHRVSTFTIEPSSTARLNTQNWVSGLMSYFT